MVGLQGKLPWVCSEKRMACWNGITPTQACHSKKANAYNPPMLTIAAWICCSVSASCPIRCDSPSNLLFICRTKVVCCFAWRSRALSANRHSGQLANQAVLGLPETWLAYNNV